MQSQTMRTHDQSVHEQFDPQAAAYLTSPVHAAGADLATAVSRVRGLTPAPGEALDVGCGAGHLSFALAPHVHRITACDPSDSMLATVRVTAAERGHSSIETVQGRAEHLPFADARFDLVCSRYSAHHWLDLPAALRQMRRVLAPGGWLVLIDLLGEEQPLVDTWLQCMELLRDPSHVRDRSAAEWSALISAAGFQLVAQETFQTRLQFGPWVERMRTPAERVVVIRSLQERAPAEVCAALGLEPDGSFTARTGLFLARAA
jgi:ubiquinone/menaquinone biosynthesis C-methylase UbiE